MAGAVTRPGPTYVRRLRAEALRVSWELRYLAQDVGSPVPSDWREAAACAPYGHRWFGLDSRIAEQVCAGCPVRLYCLRDTRATEDRLAMWQIADVAGGLSAPVRMSLQRRLRKQARDANVETW